MTSHLTGLKPPTGGLPYDHICFESGDALGDGAKQFRTFAQVSTHPHPWLWVIVTRMGAVQRCRDITAPLLIPFDHTWEQVPSNTHLRMAFFSEGGARTSRRRQFERLGLKACHAAEVQPPGRAGPEHGV